MQRKSFLDWGIETVVANLGAQSLSHISIPNLKTFRLHPEEKLYRLVGIAPALLGIKIFYLLSIGFNILIPLIAICFSKIKRNFILCPLRFSNAFIVIQDKFQLCVLI